MFMQNIANLLCPFFGKDGKPVSGGRVHFVKPDCSAAPTDGEDPDYVTVYDTDGTRLPNPLGLDDLGRFETQPFAEDGVDFRIIVEAPTGVPAELESEAPAWETLHIIDFKAQKVTVAFSGASLCDGLPDLRKASPELKCVVVLGYDEAGDFCPPRVFLWKESLYTENYGTRVRSTVQEWKNKGTWVCEPSGFVDVRWFGVAPSVNESCDGRLSKAVGTHPNCPLYFPGGGYTLSTGITAYSVIADRNVRFGVGGDHSVTFRIDGFFENRGAVFCATSQEASAARVIPVLKGTLRTSWLSGTVNEFLTGEALSNLDTVAFDGYIPTGEAAVTLTGKRLLFLDGTSPTSFEMSGCLVYVKGEKNVKVGDGIVVGGNDSDANQSVLTDSRLTVQDGDDMGQVSAKKVLVGDGSSKSVMDKESVTSDTGNFKTGNFENLRAWDLRAPDGKDLTIVAAGITSNRGFFGSGEGYADFGSDGSARITAATTIENKLKVSEEITSEGGIDTTGFGTEQAGSTGLRLHFLFAEDFGYEKVPTGQEHAPKYAYGVYLKSITGAKPGDLYAFVGVHDDESMETWYFDQDNKLMWKTDYCMVSLFLYTGEEHGFRPVGKSRP